jgi:hypothetical protein
MMEHHNVRYKGGTPAADARVNYTEAKIAVLARQNGEVKPTFGKGDSRTKAPAQPVGTQKVAASKSVTLPAFTKDEQEYVDYLKTKCKYTDQDIMNALNKGR